MEHYKETFQICVYLKIFATYHSSLYSSSHILYSGESEYNKIIKIYIYTF